MSNTSRNLRLAAIAVAGLALLAPIGPAAAEHPRMSPAHSGTSPGSGPRAAIAPAYQEIPVRSAPGSAYATVVAPSTEQFRLVGVTWPDRTDTVRADAGRVEAKVRVFAGGRWTPWQRLYVEEEHGPDPGAAARGRSGTEPIWVEPSTGVEVSLTTTDGTALSGGKVVLIDPGTSPDDEPARLETAAGEVAQPPVEPVPFPMPRIVTRRGWGADESLRRVNGAACATPGYTRTIRAAFVHHTADTNNYTRSQSAAMIRSMYAYHVKGRGWCDLGYNFVVDKYGQAFEGRYGGMHLPVLGAHTGRFNTDSFGISLIGNFERVAPTSTMLDMTSRVIAWKFDANYRSPHRKASINGVTLNAISGHRDTKATACPGKYLYFRLGEIRKRVSALMDHGASTPVYRYARALGGEAVVGAPFWGEHPTPTGRGTWFRHRDIYWSGATGAHSVRGAFRERYRAFGYSNGPLGLPASEEKAGRIRGSRVQEFEHKGTRAALYWSRATGVQASYGVIMLRYSELGAERSRLGLPTTSPYHVRHGLAQDFRGGQILWNAVTNKTKVSFR